jgi:hypothetical protein
MKNILKKSLEPKINSWLSFTVLLSACVALFSLGSQRCAAQFPSPPYSQDESTFSIGVFQIQVQPNFAFLFAPANGGTTYYPGFDPTSDILTSPVMYDSDTVIGTSALDNYPGHFSPPQTIGNPSGFGAAVNNPINQIFGFSDYLAIPSSFAFPSIPSPEEVYTEIEMFDLACPPFGCGTDERVPSSLENAGEIPMVTAGPDSLDGFPPTSGNLPIRSIGMVQQDSLAIGAAAQSFFDINITLRLPAVTDTATINDFPASDLALLTNSPSQPLMIINTNVTSLPPPVIYIHGMTPAVPLYFRENNPPYWNQGDLFGYVTLAGHGVFNCNSNSTAGGTGNSSNCCVSATSSGFVGTLLDAALGQIGNPRSGMPVPWDRASDSIPTPNTSYGSVQNTVVDPNTQETNDLDAKVTFTFGSTVVPLKDLQIGAFPTSISPPASPDSTATYTVSGIPVSFAISNSLGWLPATGTGSITMVVSNTGTANPLLYYPFGSPPQTYYTVQVTQFNCNDTSEIGHFYLELDTNNPAPDGNFILSTAGGGYSVSSEVNMRLSASTDNLTYSVSSAYSHLQPSIPPVTPGSLFISRLGTNVLVQWQNNFTLQSTTNLLDPFTDVPGPITSGSWTNNVAQKAIFYRLRD